MPLQTQFPTGLLNSNILFNLFRASFVGEDNAALNGSLNFPYVETGDPLTVVDSLGNYSISDNKLHRSSNAAATNWSDPQMYSSTFTNETGLAFYSSFHIFKTGFSNGAVGASNVINQNPTNTMAFFVYFNDFWPYTNGAQIDSRMAYSGVSTTFVDPICAEIIIISRAPGAWYFQRYKPGLWRLIWVDATVSSTPLRWRFNDLNRTSSLLRAGVSNKLPRIWKDRYGIATNRVASTSGGESAIALADALIEHTITATTGTVQELIVRKVDSNNCWIIRMSQSASTVKIIEKVGGTETERATASQTWTNGVQYRITTVTDKYCIRVYVGNSYKCEYISARTNSTATTIEVSHAGSELISWPLHVNLDAGASQITKSVLPVGDSKTSGQGDTTSPYPSGQNGFPTYLISQLNSTTSQQWREFPIRIGLGSYGVNYGTTGSLSMKAVIDSHLSTRHNEPDYIICNLGVNDAGNLSGNESQWVTDYQFIIDTLHFKYPKAKIGVARIWKSTNLSLWDSINDIYIPQVISGRSWAFLGPDERIELKGNDNGATNTVDGVHPSPSGHEALATAWRNAMGY